MQLIDLAPALSASCRFAPAGCVVVLVFVYISLNEVRPCIGYRSSIDFAGNLPRIAVMLRWILGSYLTAASALVQLVLISQQNIHSDDESLLSPPALQKWMNSNRQSMENGDWYACLLVFSNRFPLLAYRIFASCPPP